MYNEERKMQYIEEKGYMALSSTNLFSAFKKAEEREERLDRDLCEWTSEEIIDFYKWESTISVQALIQMHNALSLYASWCLSNGLISDNQNHYLEIKTEALCKCIDTEKLKRIMYTREELLETISHFNNYSDRYVFLGIFEGIPANSDIGQVKVSDIKKDILTLTNGNKLPLSTELLHIIYMTDEEEYYEAIGERRVDKFPYIETDTILKPYKARRVVETKVSVIVGRRIRRCIKYLGVPDGVNVNTLTESGRIHFMKQYAKENGIPAKEMIIDMKLRKLHEALFGKIQNCTVYLNIYGSFLEEGA